mmetsp:Transcript_18511/g.74400  ORF Transcript_18511/g.74400 Transcript_18511/m.74400 type:complete len:115 (-) Transcript_18511:2150-2494(-)
MRLARIIARTVAERLGIYQHFAFLWFEIDPPALILFVPVVIQGMVVCDLCSGTGFWRATANNDTRLRYKGVVCPTCEGKGELICGVCLGTGEGNTRGMLRKRKLQPVEGRTLQS